jgi:hypothetical protein
MPRTFQDSHTFVPVDADRLVVLVCVYTGKEVV